MFHVKHKGEHRNRKAFHVKQIAPAAQAHSQNPENTPPPGAVPESRKSTQPPRRSPVDPAHMQYPDTSGSANRGDASRRPRAPESPLPLRTKLSRKPGILKGKNPASEARRAGRSRAGFSPLSILFGHFLSWERK